MGSSCGWERKPKALDCDVRGGCMGRWRGGSTLSRLQYLSLWHKLPDWPFWATCGCECRDWRKLSNGFVAPPFFSMPYDQNCLICISGHTTVHIHATWYEIIPLLVNKVIFIKVITEMRGIIHCLKHEIIKLGTNGNMRKHKHVKRMYTVALILLLCTNDHCGER